MKWCWVVRKYNYERWSKITQSEEEQLNLNRLRTAARNAAKKKLAKEAAQRREKRLRERGIFEIIGAVASSSPSESGVAAEHMPTEDGQQQALFEGETNMLFYCSFYRMTEYLIILMILLNDYYISFSLHLESKRIQIRRTCRKVVSEAPSRLLRKHNTLRKEKEN